MKRDLFPHHRRIKGDKPKSTFGKKPYKWNNKGKKRIANDAEQNHLNMMNEQKHLLSCFVCGCEAEHLHHIKRDSTDNKNHYKLLPLCVNHHLGSEFSVHGTAKKWRERYTMEEQELYSQKAVIIVKEYKNV